MAHMWKTQFLPRIIETDEDGDVFTHIDGVDATHDVGKGQSVLFLTIGR